MKMTWKHKSKAAKRPFSAISNYPNLPFDQHQPDTSSIQEDSPNKPTTSKTLVPDEDDPKRLALSFQAQGDQLAQDGKYREALGKWEAALTLMPESAVLHEQKAQVLLEIGDAWNALKAAIRSTELEPSWPEVLQELLKDDFVLEWQFQIIPVFSDECFPFALCILSLLELQFEHIIFPSFPSSGIFVTAWITLGRAQLNFGEPDGAIESFDKALALKPNNKDAQEDRKTALNLVKRRKQLHLSGLSTAQNRFIVGDKTESS